MSRKRQNTKNKTLGGGGFPQPLSVQQRFSVDADATCKGLREPALIQ